MKKIYICSPYRNDVQKNTEFARKICREVVLKGDIPVCPHIYFTQFLEDDVKRERDMAFRCNFELLRGCDYMLVCGSFISTGMQEEIEFCKEHKIVIKYLKEEKKMEELEMLKLQKEFLLRTIQKFDEAYDCLTRFYNICDNKGAYLEMEKIDKKGDRFSVIMDMDKADECKVRYLLDKDSYTVEQIENEDSIKKLVK